jgi:hypothetical protein
MPNLKNRIENGLNEVRILILGAQVLIGATFRAFFEPGFSRLTASTQLAELVGLSIMALGVGFLLLPPAYHRIVQRGEASLDLGLLLNKCLGIALMPFALGLALGLFMSAEIIGGRRAAWWSSVSAGSIAVLMWYGPGFLRPDRSRRSMDRQKQDVEGRSDLSLTDKIKEVLMELRMVLPGTQALLGFQFVIVLMPDFDKIPQTSQWIHLASLASITISAILLIAPAAYHRIVLHGEDSERFFELAGKTLLLAMFFLGLGLAGDFFIVAEKITGSMALAAWSSTGLLIFFFVLWFGYTSWKRSRMRASP